MSLKYEPASEPMRPTSEQKGNNLTGFGDFCLEAKARIWLSLSYMCHIRSTAGGPTDTTANRTDGECSATRTCALRRRENSAPFTQQWCRGPCRPRLHDSGRAVGLIVLAGLISHPPQVQNLTR